jgi:hypothetical protein
MKISSTGMPRVLPHVDLALLPVHRPPGIDRIHAKPAMTYRVTRNCLFHNAIYLSPSSTLW